MQQRDAPGSILPSQPCLVVESGAAPSKAKETDKERLRGEDAFVPCLEVPRA
jgi:hypothetical protein